LGDIKLGDIGEIGQSQCHNACEMSPNSTSHKCYPYI